MEELPRNQPRRQGNTSVSPEMGSRHSHQKRRTAASTASNAKLLMQHQQKPRRSDPWRKIRLCHHPHGDFPRAGHSVRCRQQSRQRSRKETCQRRLGVCQPRILRVAARARRLGRMALMIGPFRATAALLRRIHPVVGPMDHTTAQRIRDQCRKENRREFAKNLHDSKGRIPLPQINHSAPPPSVQPSTQNQAPTGLPHEPNTRAIPAIRLEPE